MLLLVLDDPRRFARILTEFIDDTEPAWLEPDDMRSRVLEGP